MKDAVLFGMSKEAIMATITGVCAAIALGMFIRSLYGGSSRPYLWAWLIRMGICIVAFLSQFAGGATYSLALSGGQVLSGIIIIALIVRRQPRLGRLDVMDGLGIVLATAGVAVWMASGNPLFGLLGTILADGAATAMGVRANILKGNEESMAFWACWLVAGFATLFAAGNASLVVVLAPLFSIVNAAVNIGTVLLVRRRSRSQQFAPLAETA